MIWTWILDWDFVWTGIFEIIGLRDLIFSKTKRLGGAFRLGFCLDWDFVWTWIFGIRGLKDLIDRIKACNSFRLCIPYSPRLIPYPLGLCDSSLG